MEHEIVKFAVWTPADQTITYFSQMDDEEKDLFVFTTRHPEARLFDVREDAQACVDLYGDGIPDSVEIDGKTIPLVKERYTAEIEEIADEQEFRGRPDTW